VLWGAQLPDRERDIKIARLDHSPSVSERRPLQAMAAM
jgi:hypothetical protein